jgi:hypothetical protein
LRAQSTYYRHGLSFRARLCRRLLCPICVHPATTSNSGVLHPAVLQAPWRSCSEG